MLFKMIKNFFTACYFWLAKSTKQVRQACCVALCVAMTLGLVNLPAQTVYAKTTKISGWTAVPGASSDVARVPHPWGKYVYLRVISIKEAQSWGMDTVLKVTGLTDAYVAQSPASPVPNSTKYYPIKYSYIDTDENGKKILVDDANRSISIGTKMVTVTDVAKAQIGLVSMTQIDYDGDSAPHTLGCIFWRICRIWLLLKQSQRTG